jgi:hypothetical protein
VGLFVSLRPFVTWLALTKDQHLPLLLPTNPWIFERLPLTLFYATIFPTIIYMMMITA